MPNEYKDVLKPEDLMCILHIGKNKAYQLLKENIIPNRKIGSKYIIPKIGLINYLTSIIESA